MSNVSRKPIIGLVGGIGSGKSTVARQMAALGGAVFDADAAAKAALDRPAVRDAVAEAFGEQVLDNAGRVDRKALARVVFDAPDARRQLESIIHPRVREELDRHVAAAEADGASKFIVLDVPLLLEVGWGALCDRIVFVRADRAVRLKRLKGRGWTEGDLIQREKSQMALDKKLKVSHDVVDNNASEAACLAQVRRIVREFLISSES